MRFFTRLLCLLALLAASLTVSIAQTRSHETKPRNCSIAGRIMTGDKPVAKAKVLVVENSDEDDSPVKPDAPQVNKSYKVRTDDDGRYRVANLAAGHYTISVT